MFGSILRKFFVGLTALFWADKKRLILGIFSSFWAVQHIACAYGTDEPIDCSPLFDVAKMTGENYSDCENQLADSLKAFTRCTEVCNSVDPSSEKSIPLPWLESRQRYCDVSSDSVSVGCSYEDVDYRALHTQNLIANCSLEHIKADEGMYAYKCSDNEVVSVEEGERRIGK